MAGWVSIPDDVFADPSLAGVGPRAAWLWVCARAYCGARETDGEVPRLIVRLAGAKATDVAALLAAGLWVQSATTDAWLDHRFLDNNKTHEQREEARARDRARKSRSSTDSGTYAAFPARNPAVTPAGLPAGLLMPKNRTETVAEHPESLPPCPPSGGSAREFALATTTKAKRPRVAKGPMPADYEPTDDTRALAASLGVDLARATAECRDHFGGKGQPMADWHATLRNWVRREPTMRRTPTNVRQIQGNLKPGDDGGWSTAHLLYPSWDDDEKAKG